MIQKTIHIKATRTTRVNGSDPSLWHMRDELDSLVAAYGPETVIQMFEDAKPKFYSFGPFNPPVHGI